MQQHMNAVRVARMTVALRNQDKQALGEKRVCDLGYKAWESFKF